MKILNVLTLFTLQFITMVITQSSAQANEKPLQLLCEGQQVGHTYSTNSRDIVMADDRTTKEKADIVILANLMFEKREGSLDIKMRSASAKERYRVIDSSMIVQHETDGQRIKYVNLGSNDDPTLEFYFHPQDKGSEGTLVVWNHARASRFGGIYKLSCRTL